MCYLDKPHHLFFYLKNWLKVTLFLRFLKEGTFSESQPQIAQKSISCHKMDLKMKANLFSNIFFCMFVFTFLLLMGQKRLFLSHNMRKIARSLFSYRVLYILDTKQYFVGHSTLHS